MIQQPETYVSADRLVDRRLIPALTQVFNIASRTVNFSTIHISATTNGHDESEVSNHKVENGARAIDISRIDEQPIEKLGPIHPLVIDFQKAIDKLPNVRENFGPYWLHKGRVVYSPKPLPKKQKLQEDHKNHIHFSINE